MSTAPSSRDAVIVDAVRTPVGRRGGALRDWHPLDLLAHTLDHLVRHSGADADALDDLIAGCALQRGEQAGNVARNALLGAGLPIGLPGTTIVSIGHRSTLNALHDRRVEMQPEGGRFTPRDARMPVPAE